MALHGRPSPEELLDGAIASLRDTVLPALADEVAADRLRSVLAVLAYLRQRWDRAVADLVEEAEGIEGALRLAGREPPPAASGLDYRALAARADALHEALLEALLQAERGEAGDEGAVALEALRAELAAVARRRR
jgi:hypothetical protein